MYSWRTCNCLFGVAGLCWWCQLLFLDCACLLPAAFLASHCLICYCVSFVTCHLSLGKEQNTVACSPSTLRVFAMLMFGYMPRGPNVTTSLCIVSDAKQGQSCFCMSLQRRCLSQTVRAAHSTQERPASNHFPVVDYKETRWLGMRKQSGTRAGNHERHTRTISTSPPTQANNAARAANGNPQPGRCTCMESR